MATATESHRSVRLDIMHKNICHGGLGPSDGGDSNVRQVSRMFFRCGPSAHSLSIKAGPAIKREKPIANVVRL